MTDAPTPPSSSYEFTDHSLLRPWVTRVWFRPLFALLPPWLAANLVTIGSTGALVLFVSAGFATDRLGTGAYALLQLVALQLYVAGDHLDGMQAKASGTMSPLGDFLDHHCDLWAGAVLILGFSRLTSVGEAGLLGLDLCLIAGFAITYGERAVKRRLHFTRWGTLEAIAILSVFYLSWSMPAMRAWWERPLVAGWPRHAIIPAVGVAMVVGVIGVIARRIGTLPAAWLIFVADEIAIGAWCVREPQVPPMLAWLLLTVIGAEYVARVMRAHTVAGVRPLPDALAITAAAALWFTPWSAASTATVVLAVLVVRYGITLWQVLAPWRHHWVWFNASVGRDP